MTKKARDTTQFAALPWRLTQDGLQVMLLTSRETRRWVIPKGWPIKGRTPAEVARQEAYEEAGLIGQVIGKHPIGCFHYAKQIGTDTLLCSVHVFLFRVTQQLDSWPEQHEREIRWFDPAEAARLVDEGGLAELIGSLTRRRARA